MKSKMCVLVFAISLLPAGIFANGNGEANGTDSVTKISAVFDRCLTEENGLKEWGEKYSEISGLKLSITKPAHNQYSQILSTIFASGDYPDVLEIQTNDYLTFANSGHLVPLEDYIAESEQFKDVSKDLIEAYRLKDGHIYGVPSTNADGCVTYIRQDWLDNLGLDMPTNWDEYYKVLKAFTYDDPDGNGVKDTVGITLPFQTGYEFDYYNRMIMQDAYFGYDQKNGKWVDGFQQPEMIKALERFSLLYKEGILDNEFFTNKTSTARSKIFEGQAGVMEYWIGSWATRFDDSAKNINPKASVVSMPAIENAYYINRVVPAFSITSKAADPKMVFDKFMNLMIDKAEGQKLFIYGVEGLHYKTTANGIEMLAEPSNPDKLLTKAYCDPNLAPNGMEALIEVPELIRLSAKNHDSNARQLGLPQGGDVFLKRNSEILTLKQEIFAETIIGAYTPAEAIAIYKTKAKALGIDEIIAELNR
ncbi:extracellular solute-binding protein [Thiospirochaeta perfilievii]|nr:extracellular solute-binding protein [Thiospirochaeta perfilievii]